MMMSKQKSGSAIRTVLFSRTVVTVLLSLSGLMIGAFAWSESAPVSGQPVLASAAQIASHQTVTTVLGPEGFTPPYVMRAVGAFRLEVENQSGVENLTLQLKHRDGRGVGEWPMPEGAQTWSEVIDLMPGVYILSEANNPAWLYQITIE